MNEAILIQEDLDVEVSNTENLSLESEIFEAGERAGHTNWFEGRVRGGYKFDFERDNSKKLHSGLLNFDALQFLRKNENLLLQEDPVAFADFINISKLKEISGDNLWNEKISEYNKSLDFSFSLQFHVQDTSAMQQWLNFILGEKSSDANHERRGFINNNENWGNAAVQLYDLFKNNPKGLEKYAEETEEFLNEKTIGGKMRVFEMSEGKLLMTTLLDRYRFWGDRNYGTRTSQKSIDSSKEIEAKLGRLRFLSDLSSVTVVDPDKEDYTSIYFEAAPLYMSSLKKFQGELEETQDVNQLISEVRRVVESGDNPPVIEFAFMYEIAYILEDFIQGFPNNFNVKEAKQAYDNLVNYSIDLDANLGVIEVVREYMND